MNIESKLTTLFPPIDEDTEKRILNKVKSTDNEIMIWIEEHQKGRSGIYPYQVALQACAEFQISIEEAQDFVTRHIKQVLRELA